MNELQCEKCLAFYRLHEKANNIALVLISAETGTPQGELKAEYLARYHGRGHRKALRDDA